MLTLEKLFDILMTCWTRTAERSLKTKQKVDSIEKAKERTKNKKYLRVW